MYSLSYKGNKLYNIIRLINNINDKITQDIKITFLHLSIFNFINNFFTAKKSKVEVKNKLKGITNAFLTLKINKSLAVRKEGEMELTE